MSFSTEASNTVAIVERVATDAVKALEPLANELGMAAKYVFQLFVVQNYVHAAQAGLWALGCVALAIFLYKWQKKVRSAPGFDWFGRYEPTGEGVFVVLALVAICICIVVASTQTINVVVPRVINPQYYAIQDMVETGRALIPATPAQ